jgi:hypothetical protein
MAECSHRQADGSEHASGSSSRRSSSSGGDSSGSGSGSGSDSEDEEQRQQQRHEHNHPRPQHRQPRDAACAACSSHRLQLVTSSSWGNARSSRQPQSVSPGAQRAALDARANGSSHFATQPWLPRDCGSHPGSPPRAHAQPQAQHPQQWQHSQAAGACNSSSSSSSTVSTAEALRLFSRPVSESSLPDDLRSMLATPGGRDVGRAAAGAHLRPPPPAAMAAAAPPAPAPAAAGSSGGGGGGGGARLPLRLVQQVSAFSSVCGSSSSSGGGGGGISGVRSSPFLAYDMSALMGAAAADAVAGDACVASP